METEYRISSGGICGFGKRYIQFLSSDNYWKYIPNGKTLICPDVDENLCDRCASIWERDTLIGAPRRIRIDLKKFQKAFPKIEDYFEVLNRQKKNSLDRIVLKPEGVLPDLFCIH